MLLRNVGLRRYLDWVTLTYISRSIDFYTCTSPFHMSSTVRPSTTKSYIVLLDVLTRQVPWPGDLELYFALQWLTHFTLMFGISSNIRPTTTKPWLVLHLIALAWQVPWPSDVDLYLIHFTLMFDNSSTIRPTTTIPCIVLLLDVLNEQVPWPVTLTYISRSSDFYTFYVNVPLSLGCIIRKVSAEDIAIRGNGTGLEYMCPTRHCLHLFQPSFPTKHC